MSYWHDDRGPTVRGRITAMLILAALFVVAMWTGRADARVVPEPVRTVRLP